MTRAAGAPSRPKTRSHGVGREQLRREPGCEHGASPPSQFIVSANLPTLGGVNRGPSRHVASGGRRNQHASTRICRTPDLKPNIETEVESVDPEIGIAKYELRS